MNAAQRAVHLFGVPLIGVTAENGRKLLLTVILCAGVLLIGAGLRALLGWVGARTGSHRFRFWGRQAVGIVLALILVIGLASIWFDNPARLTTALGLVTAGVAFALQRVITATAGYFVILRGHTFNVGDRIVMGGVRGDVIALGFMQTTIMEMGEPPPVQSAAPAVWVHSRQFTGRIVTVTNAKIFDEAVYNYTRDFPYIWDEMRLPIRYPDDRATAERILLEAANRHALRPEAIGDERLAEVERRFGLKREETEPRVYWRLTDNWLELTVRFLAPDHGVRGIKDAMSREILQALDQAGIGIASATYEITAAPVLRIARAGEQGGAPAPAQGR